MTSSFNSPNGLDSKLGATFIGNLVAAVFYGITCVQTYMYFRQNDRDRTWFKGVIYFLWILDTLHIAFISHALYYYLVSNFGNLAALVSPSWSALAQVYATCVNDLIIRCIFGRRVWLMTGKNYLVAVSIGITSFLTFGSGFAFTSLAYHGTFSDFQKISYLLYLALGSGVVADFLIAGFLCINLWRQRTSFNKTNSLVRMLMLYTINTTLLTTICSMTCFITYTIWPNDLTFLGIYFSLSKLFLNSLLATLNSREILSDKLGGVKTFSSPPLTANGSRNTLDNIHQPSVLVNINREVIRDDYGMENHIRHKATSSIL